MYHLVQENNIKMLSKGKKMKICLVKCLGLLKEINHFNIIYT